MLSTVFLWLLLKFFSLVFSFSSLIMTFLGRDFSGFITLEFDELYRPTCLCLSLKLVIFQPLCLPILFLHFIFSSFWGDSMIEILNILVLSYRTLRLCSIFFLAVIQIRQCLFILKFTNSLLCHLHCATSPSSELILVTTFFISCSYFLFLC